MQELVCQRLQREKDPEMLEHMCTLLGLFVSVQVGPTSLAPCNPITLRPLCPNTPGDEGQDWVLHKQKEK